MNLKAKLKSSKKNKALITSLASEAIKNPKLLTQVVACIKEGTGVEKGALLEVIEHVTKENPELTKKYINFVIEYINYEKAPRVRWESSCIIANIAGTFPNEVMKAVPKLLINTTDKGTVVRWSAAFALTEIAKYNPKVANTLVLKFHELIKTEKNNGVRNVYLKTIALFASGGCCA